MNTVPLRYIAAVNETVLPEDTAPDFEFKYIDISQVDGNGNVTIPDELVSFAAAPSRARRIAVAGATVVSTVRTYLRAIGTVPESDKPLVFSTGFAVIRPTQGDYRYFGYACRSDQFVHEVVSRSVGVSYPAINPGDLMGIRMPSLNLDEQRRIADFLDDRVARIDQIIAARRQQLANVEVLPWAAFSFAVARPDIRRLPLRRAIAKLADGPFGSAFASDDYTADGPAVIRLGNIGFAEFRWQDLARVPNEIYERFPNAHVRSGDVLIASLGDARNHAGRACVAPADLGSTMVKGKCFVARVNPAVATEHFLATLLSSPAGAEQLVGQGTGATRSMLNFERLLSTAVPLPDLERQTELTNEFVKAKETAGGAHDMLLASVDALQEYKQSLITAAVTGELDVTTAGSGIPG